MNHIALIFGGPSAEHDVSVISAKNIFQALQKIDIEVSLLGVTHQRQWKLIEGEQLLGARFEKPLDLENIGKKVELKREDGHVTINGSTPIDVAYPIIHGPYGEDGELQAELNQLGLQFVGSDQQACENAIDKVKTKAIIATTDIPQVPHLIFEGEAPHFESVETQLGLPCFVKPARMGSSVGISKVKNPQDYEQAIAEAKKFDTVVVIEKGVKARELECALLVKEGEVQVTDFGEIIPNHEFYSYEAKYLDPNGAELVIPAQIDSETATQMKSYAKKAFQALGCRDYCRCDFFLTDDGSIYFNEINTHPGSTSISLFPLLWQKAGMTYEELVLHMLELANKRRS